MEAKEPTTNTTAEDEIRGWWMDAACLAYTGVANFFPARNESAQEAKAICATCTVRVDCLEYAMSWEYLHGVWGGLAEGERNQLRTQRERQL